MDNHKELTDLALYLNSALAGEVTENVRAIAASETSNHVNLRFIFFQEPSEQEIEIMGYVGAEVLSNYDEKSGDERYDVIPTGVLHLSAGEFIAYERR